MTSIKLTVTGAQAWASVSGPLTSGMVGVPISIAYDEAWDGLTKNLVCRCSEWGSVDGEYRTILNVGEAAVVAHEVMKSGMYLHLGVEGYSSDGMLVIPTTWASCGKIQPGANTGTDLSADPTLPVWNQLQVEMEKTKEYVLTPEQAANIQTYAQEARQAAEEARQAVENGLYYMPVVTQPTSNTVKFEFKPSVTGAPIPKSVTVELPGGDSSQNGNGLSSTASALLITILRNGNYDTDQSANITALEAALASGGSSGGDSGGNTDAVTYSITNNLTNVVNSNSAAGVTANAAYSATLTAAEGYVLGAVVVVMGGVDVTDTVYTNGYITIAQVTGNVVITATATASTVQTEELTEAVKISGWPVPDETTGEWSYTEGDGYVAVLPGQLYGGVLTMEWNTEECAGFNVSIRTCDASGKAAHLSSAPGANIDALTWVVFGDSAATATVTASPVSVRIPDGEKPMIVFRRNPDYGGSAVTSNNSLTAWVADGGVKCTITTGGEA